MARPNKQGLDYFPLDVYIDQDDKVMLIEAEYGAVGFAIIVKLLMKIYSEGYFYEWDKRQQLLFSKKVNVDINTVCEVVSACINWGLFNQKLYEKYGVLTSRGIKKRYVKASGRRNKVCIDADLLLLAIDDPETGKKLDIRVNVHINEVNVDNNPANKEFMSTETTQSKVNKSKVNKSKINNYVAPPSEDDDCNDDSFEDEASEEVGDNICIELSILLREKILKNNPSARVPDNNAIKKWAVHVDRMIRIDERDPADIEEHIIFSQWHHFWKKNILSTKKLRDQYDRLTLEMQSNDNSRGQPVSSGIPIGRVTL